MECYPAKLQHRKCSTDITGKILLIYIFYNEELALPVQAHMPEAPAELTVQMQKSSAQV